MNQTKPRGRKGIAIPCIASRWLYTLLVVSLSCLLLSVRAQAFTVVVEDEAGAPISGFKWLIEEDNTHDPRPGEHLTPGVDDTISSEAGVQNTLSIDLHRSHSPVLNSGNTATASASVDAFGGGALPDGRYFVSVLAYGTADTTYDMGGTSLTIEGGVVTKAAGVKPSAPDTVRIKLRANPIQTAQISVRVFHDIAPLDNAPSIGEPALAGFTITIGDQGGDIVQDAFGNKLGTTYQRDGNGDIIFNPDGTPAIDVVGTGDFVTSCASGDPSSCLDPDDGIVFIKNLAPGKYGIQVEPPAGTTTWHQVTTIEGTKTIDAWVRPNEPAFLAEFGPPITHVFYGFTQNLNRLSDPAIFPAPQNATTVTGQIKKAHLTRPPSLVSNEGGELGTSPCIVGLNAVSAAAGAGQSVYVGECAADGTFSIPDVPDGTFQLVVFDKFLDIIIYFQTVIVNAEGALDLGVVPVNMWFGEQDQYVFSDTNQDGFRDSGEVGIPEMNINLRYRDGTIYQAFPTDSEGAVPFEEIFPWFHWLVAEVDFARLKATGLTTVVDNGGVVTNDAFGEGKRNPVINPATNQPFFTETGPVLTQGYQQFAGQNTRFEWGKAPYDTGDHNAVNNEVDWWNELQNWPNGAGDNDTCNADADACADPGTGDGVYDNNGGISGVVFYATTRAEDDPRFAAGEPWEPGITRVQVNLYHDMIDNATGLGVPFGDGLPDRKDVDGCGATAVGCYPWTPVYADVDNYPQGNFPGPEDVDHNSNNAFDLGDAMDVTYTDSWDDNLPTDCVGNADAVGVAIHGVNIPISDCADGLRTWNQARPAVFDGGYAFGPQDPLLAAGNYIVEAATPPGYKLVKEEDRNVDFGATPVPALLPAECIGDAHTVPPYFTFATQNSDGQLPLMPWATPAADFAAPFAGESRLLCDRKKVSLSGGQNSAADFFLFTDVPRAARGVGLITDDLANEASVGKPTFSEKFAPGWMAISWRDYTGKEILRSYSDEFGGYNTLLPSTYSIDLPTPSGVGPKMAQLCLNDPGPIPNPAYDGVPGGNIDLDGDPEFIDDPQYKNQYSTTCYNLQFEAGRITYLDTPIIRIAAFTGPLQSTLDCEQPNGTPVISQAIGSLGYGPYISGDGASLQLISVGSVDVPNPDYPGDTAPADGIPDDPPVVPQLVPRDFGFGAVEGQVCVTPNGGAEFCFDPADVNWSNSTIDISVPAGAVAAGLATGQLTVKHSSGGESAVGITLTVGPPGGTIHRVMAGESIQDTIDLAATNDLILVDPGVYGELLIMNKKVKLQGSGASTVINARHFSGGTGLANPLDTWRTKIALAVDAGVIGMVGNQPALNPMFADGEGPGIFVSPPNPFSGPVRARIDGMTIRNGDVGGGIYANTNARGLQISNVRLETNSGNFGGGIRVGNPTQVVLAAGQTEAPDGSVNENMRIVHNQIINNGSNQNGGGVAIFKGATNYRVTDNLMCGNFSRSGGGAISHLGLSDEGRIENNQVLFNEAFQGMELGGGGGGIEIAGDLPADPAVLTEGSGDVLIHANHIQGNLAGASDGGGIALRRITGLDLGSGDKWEIRIYDNFIVNNATGLAGGGISMSDATDVFIIHNTIANNDSTASAAAAFVNGTTVPSVPQPAGVVSRAFSAELAAAATGPDFTRPRQFRKNIIWHNRTYYYDSTQATNGLGGLVPRAVADGGPYWDLGVLDTGNPAGTQLVPRQSFLTDATGFLGSNLDGDPLFVDPYVNTLQAATAADEGGNFVQFFFTPLGLTGDYHLSAASPAINEGSTTYSGGILSEDIDGDARPSAERPGRTDIGADEVPAP
jgi:hypothetical protein